jgi:predicted transcriptional regulator of viral defense system
VKATDAYVELLRMDRPVVTTREAAARWHTAQRAAGQRLRALEEAGLLRRLRRGLWALDLDLPPFAIAPYLTAPFPAYVSFWSALSHHGLIEQIPRQISVASLDRTRRVDTAVGAYDVHRIAPDLFDGYRGAPETGYLATPEKALFDTVYVRAAKGGKAFFTELLLPGDFDDGQLDEWIGQVGSPRLRTLVARRLREVLRPATRGGAEAPRAPAGA